MWLMLNQLLVQEKSNGRLVTTKTSGPTAHIAALLFKYNFALGNDRYGRNSMRVQKHLELVLCDLASFNIYTFLTQKTTSVWNAI